MGEKEPEIRNVIFLGPSGAGKTCLIQKFVTGKFEENSPTVATQFLQKNFHANDLDIEFHLFDTAGQERFQDTIPISYYRAAHVAIICFEFIPGDSLDINPYLVKLHEINPTCETFLVATKFDLHENEQTEINQFMNDVSTKYKFIKEKYLVSSVTGYKVSELFEDCARVEIKIQNTPETVQLQQEVKKGDEEKGCC